MEFVKKSQAKKIQNSPVCFVWEYETEDEVINGAVAGIKGRYPDKGRVENKESKELVLVLISPKERYYFQGDLKLFLVNAPKWTPQQHKLVK